MYKQDPAEKLPLFQKAELLFQLVEGLVASLPEDDDYIQATKGLMLEDAIIIPAKIAGAESGDLYSIRMQNAAIIREHAMHLYVQVGSLRFQDSYKDLEYVHLIRKEIDEFRLLFIDWVANFDTENHYWDEWGLFNPPGAVPPIEGLPFLNDTLDHSDFDDFDEDFDDDFDDEEE
jgi:hypothetical protein